MLISDCSSDVCSSDLDQEENAPRFGLPVGPVLFLLAVCVLPRQLVFFSLFQIGHVCIHSAFALSVSVLGVTLPSGGHGLNYHKCLSPRMIIRQRQVNAEWKSDV